MAAIAASADVAQKTPRIGILDTARGAALLAMASYHGTWDFEFFGYLDSGTAETGWLKLYARAIASTFLFLAGFSLVLANTPEIRWRSYWRRLGMIVAAAAAISLVTFIGMQDEWIFFGILHSIAAASLIGLLFLRLPAFLTLLVAALLTVGIVIDNVVAPLSLHSTFFDTPWLWWVGLSENIQRSNDYVPLFPWLTPFLFGLGIAQLALSLGWLKHLAKFGPGRNLVARAGRHSLIFYLVHQPVLFGLVYLLSLVAPAPPQDPTVGYIRQCVASCTRSGSEAMCRSFCQCTLDKLQAQNLFKSLESGAIKADSDERVSRIAIQCTDEAQ
ncbi:heparan-alpha-glucosaminide N-acetyltransferase [Rhizobium sp. WW22]|uniref:heparan-alpha-glucosaminide N-acetyltransferase n=1 Tax=Rhizobium sp. WW22 TaxID=3389070 RepID=UPI000DD5F1D5